MLGSLFKLTVFGGLVLLVLPIDTGQPLGTSEANVGVIETVAAARDVATDLKSFCNRQPDACAVGNAALSTIKAKAQVSAEHLAAILAEREKAGLPVVKDPVTTATVTLVPDVPVPTARPSL